MGECDAREWRVSCASDAESLAEQSRPEPDLSGGTPDTQDPADVDRDDTRSRTSICYDPLDASNEAEL